jgi:hypothetical protein
LGFYDGDGLGFIAVGSLFQLDNHLAEGVAFDFAQGRMMTRWLGLRGAIDSKVLLLMRMAQV